MPQDLLGTLSPTGGASSSTPSGFGSGSILQPTPTPLNRTDKDFYRSLFGSLSSEPSTPAPPPAEPASSFTSNGPDPTPQTPLDFSFPSFGEPQAAATPAATPSSHTQHMTPSGASAASTFSFPDFGSLPAAPNGGGMDIFASFGAAPTPTSSAPAPSNQAPLDFHFPAFGDSPANPPAPTPVPSSIPVPQSGAMGAPMNSSSSTLSPSGPSASLFDMPSMSSQAIDTSLPQQTSTGATMGSTGAHSFSSSSGGLFDFAPPPSASRPPTEAKAIPPPTSTSTDLFQSFGSMGSPPSASTAPPSALASSPPSHGSFSGSSHQILPPSSPATFAPTPQTPSLDALMRTFQRLLQSERYAEAEQCRQHIAATKQIAQVTPQLQMAKEQHDYVRSLELRQTLEEWQKKLASEHAMQGWQQSTSSSHRTFAQMQRLIEESAGSAPALRFHRQYNQAIAQALQSGDLPTLIRLQQEASQQLHTFQSGIPIVRGDTVARWGEVLRKCIVELTQAQRHLHGIESHLKEAEMGEAGSAKLFQAPRAVTFTAGLVEIYRLVKRIQSSIGYYEHQGSPSLQDPATHFDSLWKEADRVWSDLVQFLQRLAQVQMPRVDDVGKDSIQEESFKQGACSLCLLPFAPNDSTLKWAGAPYHAPCANFYCNRLSTSPPTEESFA